MDCGIQCNSEFGPGGGSKGHCVRGAGALVRWLEPADGLQVPAPPHGRRSSVSFVEKVGLACTATAIPTHPNEVHKVDLHSTAAQTRLSEKAGMDKEWIRIFGESSVVGRCNAKHFHLGHLSKQGIASGGIKGIEVVVGVGKAAFKGRHLFGCDSVGITNKVHNHVGLKNRFLFGTVNVHKGSHRDKFLNG